MSDPSALERAEVDPADWVATIAAARDDAATPSSTGSPRSTRPTTSRRPGSTSCATSWTGRRRRALRRKLFRTRVPDGSSLASLTGVFRGAAWHERETHEMFGLDFDGFDDGTGLGLRPLLLPDGFEGTPLRKSFVLAARASKPWPGAKEPGESEHAKPTGRRRVSGARRARPRVGAAVSDAARGRPCARSACWRPSSCCRCSSARPSTR